jgi:DNA polymerase-3 subunit beta
MKLQINQEFLEEGLKLVNKCISKNTSFYILTGVYLKTVDGGIMLKSTDLEIGIELFLKCDVQEEGEMIIPSEKLIKYVTKLPKDCNIKINTKNNGKKILIKSDVSQLTLNLWDAKEFPDFKKVTKNKINFDSSDLRKIFKKVEYATSNGEQQPGLSGIKMIIEDNNLDVVATDTYRLSYYFDNDMNVKNKIDIILPAKAINVLLPLLEIGKVELIFNDSFINFNLLESNKDIKLQSRIIQADYPNYKQVIPNENDKKIKVNKDKFKNSIERLNVINSDYLKMTFQNDKLIMENNENGDEIEEKIECQTKDDQLIIGIDGEYILDCLKNIDTNEIIIEGKNELSPLVIKEIDNNNWKYILMPKRLA